MRRPMLAAALIVSHALFTAPAYAQDWALDSSKSTVEFEARAFGDPLTGSFERFSADIRLDPDDLASARIDASVDTSSATLSNDRYRSNLSGGDGLAVEAHPEARFVSEDIRATDDGYEAVGELTIKGASRPLTLPFTLSIDGDRAVAQGAFTIERASFGVGSGSWGDVGPSVTVTLHIEADRAG